MKFHSLLRASGVIAGTATFLARTPPLVAQAPAGERPPAEASLTAPAEPGAALDRPKAATVHAEAPGYQPGYDPAQAQRDGIGVLPDAAWGETVNGLRAALAGPDKVRQNEKAAMKLVIRNVSERPVRLAVSESSFASHFSREGEGGSRQVMDEGRGVTRWELSPGHQTVVPCGLIQFRAADDPGPLRALSLEPGVYLVKTSLAAGAGEWSGGPGRKSLIMPPADEWSGRLRAAPHRLELLADKVPPVIPVPPEFPADHGLTPSFTWPFPANGRPFNHLDLRPGLTLYFNPERDEHWLLDPNSCDRNVYWGPVNAAKMQLLGLLDLMEKVLLNRTSSSHGQLQHTATLIGCEAPMAAAGLRIVSQFTPASSGDYLARTVREQRPELIRKGLEGEMRAALDHLTKSYAPLPPDAEFTVITSTAIPEGLVDAAWGPENDGLRAAALMPEAMEDDEPGPARLFIRNVSNHAIHLTVSDRPGFDSAIVADRSGKPLHTQSHTVYPNYFSSVLRPEINPGETPQEPPTAILKKLLLQPGAIHELETPGRLAWSLPTPGTNEVTTAKAAPFPPDRPWRESTTFLNTLPGEVTVTWQLRTTNGTEWSKDSKKRLWPAKGGWSGILRTGPQKVMLRDRTALRSYPAGTPPAGWSDYDYETQVSTGYQCAWGPAIDGWHAALALPGNAAASNAAPTLLFIRNAGHESRSLTISVTDDRRIALSGMEMVRVDGSAVPVTLPPDPAGMIEKATTIPPGHMVMLRGPAVSFKDPAPRDAIRAGTPAGPVFVGATLGANVLKGLTLRTGTLRLTPTSPADEKSTLPLLVPANWKPAAHAAGNPGCAEFLAHCAKVAAASGVLNDPVSLIKWGPPNGTVRAGLVIAPYAPIGCPREAWLVLRDDSQGSSGIMHHSRASASMMGTDAAGAQLPESYGSAGLPERLWAESLTLMAREQIEMPLPWIIFGYQNLAAFTGAATLRTGSGRVQVRCRIDANVSADVTVEVDEDDRRPLDPVAARLTERPAPTHCAFDPSILTPAGRSRLENLTPGGTVAEWNQRFRTDGGLSALWEERVFFEDAGAGGKVVMFSLIIRPAEMTVPAFADPALRRAWYEAHPKWDRSTAVVAAITEPRLDLPHAD